MADLEQWALRQGLSLGEGRGARRQRRNTRYDVQQQVRFGTLDPHHTADGKLIQVSRDALVIRSPRKLPLTAKVACGLFIDRSGTKELVLVKGRVIRVLDDDDNAAPGFVMSIDRSTIDSARLVASLVGLVVIEPTPRVERHHARKVA